MAIDKKQKNFWKIFSQIIIDYLFPLVLTNLGIIIISRDELMGIALLVLAFLIFYFARNIEGIRINEDSIREIKEEIESAKKELEIDRKLLNTLKDILLVKSVQNKR